jgi:hypothetical protein
VKQGSVLSLLLFNVYLEKALISKTKIKDGIEEGDINAFADGLLLVVKNKKHAE